MQATNPPAYTHVDVNNLVSRMVMVAAPRAAIVYVPGTAMEKLAVARQGIDPEQHPSNRQRVSGSRVSHLGHRSEGMLLVKYESSQQCHVCLLRDIANHGLLGLKVRLSMISL